MKIVAVTSEQMLEAVLHHLHATGWPIVDFEKLVDAYMDFRSRARRCVYGIVNDPQERDTLRYFIERDIVELERDARVIRTMSRVHITPRGLAQTALLKLEQARFGTLLTSASTTFPPLTPKA